MYWLDGEWAYTGMLAQSRQGISAEAPLVRGKPQTAEDVYVRDPGRGGDIYTKGAWTLHTLRNLIGDKAFFDAVRLLVRQRTDPKPGNYQQPARATPAFAPFVKKPSRKDYQWVFDVSIDDAEQPELVATRSGDNGNFKIVKTASQERVMQ